VKFYGGLIKDREAAAQSISATYEHMRSIVNRFAIEASSLLSLNAINFEDFAEKGGADRLFQQIARNVQIVDEASRRLHDYNALAEHVSLLFGESPDLFARVSELRECIDAHITQLKVTRKKNRELRAQLRGLTSDTDHRIQELISQNIHLTESLEDSQRNLDEASECVRRVKKDLHAAKHQLKELENSAASSEAALKADHAEALDRLNRDSNQLQKQLNEHIEKLKSELFSASQTIAANEISVGKLQKLILSQERTIAFERAKAAELSRATAQGRAEKEKLVETYESALSDLRQQCDGHRNDLEKTMDELACLQKWNRKAQRIIVSLKHDKQELKHALVALQERSERSLEVATAVGKNAQLAAQASFTQKLQDAQGHCDNEKRRIFSLAADEFRTYFNAAESLDEGAYRQLLSTVKTEVKRLTELESVVRRLVGAAPGQQTDDAVAQLLT
jgi:chromosome segregation ATPase